jgi:hypothetical protein
MLYYIKQFNSILFVFIYVQNEQIRDQMKS